MELQLFTDLIDALSKVSDGLKTLANFPKSERDKYRQILEETYRLIDTTLNMVIIRLGNILYLNDDSEFISEIVKLDNFQEWYKAERNFRLCHSLRASVREMERLATELSGRISIKDLDRLVQLMHEILASENEVAYYISMKFRELSDFIANAEPSADKLNQIREHVKHFRSTLIQERQWMIQQEQLLYDTVI